MRSNSIYGNGLLGIDLRPSGVTLNDVLDEDEGPNKHQNFPEISSVTTTGGSVRVIGTLNSRPSAAFDIDFYQVDLCDGLGYGEGQVPLGSTSVTTDPAGNVSFDVTLIGIVPAGGFVTSTATSSDGATSEFSACLTVVGIPPPAVTGLTFSGPPETLSWDAAPGGDLYHLYAGTGATVGGLSSPAADSCEALVLPSTGFQLPPASNPPPGHFLWVLVTAEGPYGEGPVQPGSNGPRTLTSTGECGDSCGTHLVLSAAAKKESGQ